eukprot:scaffold4204_cov140-Isochrysis_galbana.AAC.5
MLRQHPERCRRAQRPERRRAAGAGVRLVPSPPLAPRRPLVLWPVAPCAPLSDDAVPSRRPSLGSTRRDAARRLTI